MNTLPHVIYPDQVAPYQPANHTGTSNRRIIGRDTVAARRLEVLIGTISKGTRRATTRPSAPRTGLLSTARRRRQRGTRARAAHQCRRLGL